MDKLDQLIRYAVEEFATEGIQITDAEGNYIFCNHAFSLLTGLPVTERLGYNVMEVQPDGAAAAVLRSGFPVYGKVSTSGDVVLVSNAAPIRNEEGKTIGIITIFTDKTSYVKLSQSLKDREAELLKLKGKLRQLERPAYSFQDIVGESPAFQACIQRAMRAASSDASVLITGESGTGKELLAHAIHGSSSRAEGPFIRVNCPAIPENLLESELFGHEKGAFTGAIKEKMGKFELAQNGSIFLDEIGDMDFVLQAKLLRVLQEHEVERIGATKTIPLNVRVIAATNQNLQERIQQGKFRRDLYYRLNVVQIEIPPLRQRKSDIAPLLNHMMKKHSMGAVPCTISREALETLMDYDWPGNVRELENIAERLLLYREGSVIGREDVLRILGECEDVTASRSFGTLSLAKIEELAIKQALERCGDTLEGKKRAAAELGISLSGLYKKLKQYREI